MVRRKIYFEVGHYYHLFNRGNNRGRIFFDENDYAFFLRRVSRYLSPVVDVVAYCLMPTHYHILIRVRPVERSTPEDGGQGEGLQKSEAHESVSGAVQRLTISYTRCINKNYRRVGALFQGHYRFKLIDDRGYLQYLSRYIHRNPVEAGLVSRCADWPWSSYLEYVQLREGTLPHPAVIMEEFTSSEAYGRFVEQALSHEPAGWKKMLIDI